MIFLFSAIGEIVKKKKLSIAHTNFALLAFDERILATGCHLVSSNSNSILVTVDGLVCTSVRTIYCSTVVVAVLP